MDYKVSYRSFWNNEGFHYDQVVTVRMLEMELNDLNTVINNERDGIKSLICFSAAQADVLMYLKNFHVGENFTTHTSRDYFFRYFHMLSDNRVKTDRNTLFIIKLRKRL